MVSERAGYILCTYVVLVYSMFLWRDVTGRNRSLRETLDGDSYHRFFFDGIVLPPTGERGGKVVSCVQDGAIIDASGLRG